MRPNPGTSVSCSTLVPNGWSSSASKVLKRANNWSLSPSRWSMRALNWSMLRSSVSTAVRFCTSPGPLGSGVCSSRVAAIGSIRAAGIRLPGKKLPHAPLRGSRLSGSHSGACPEKSPPRTAEDGTENVCVSERSVRCPSKLTKKNVRSRTIGPPTVPPYWP